MTGVERSLEQPLQLLDRHGGQRGAADGGGVEQTRAGELRLDRPDGEIALGGSRASTRLSPSIRKYRTVSCVRSRSSTAIGWATRRTSYPRTTLRPMLAHRRVSAHRDRAS